MEPRMLQQSPSLWFEDFAVGDAVESLGRTVTEADVVNFAALSGDWNLIHTDAEYAREQMYGQRVVHGLLVLSISSGQMVRLGFLNDTTIAFMGLDWQFRRPVFINDTIRTRLTVSELRAMKRLDGGKITFKVEVINQEGKQCQRGSWELLCKSREAQAD
ncbi:MAG: dehydratase [Caldilineaceae bacterium SB0662_bin_9]|uniref:Dehydratase n=1 Tax=Caldilineaceae bacterium SB0662_bin_9 TaxID=2605258 RepID=A0A6B1DX05_9CHLR|nr:dehydratase [Caldilineaceae bacterium SB0666_bin_21]MYD90884.1 dehydratase [Caldilineaceae bacterium SB0662_bin_9]